MARRPRTRLCGTVVAPDRDFAGNPYKACHFGCRERRSHRRSAAHRRGISVHFRNCRGELGLPGGGGESRTAVPTNDRRDEVAPVFHHRHIVRSPDLGSCFSAALLAVAPGFAVFRVSARPRARSRCVSDGNSRQADDGAIAAWEARGKLKSLTPPTHLLPSCLCCRQRW